MTDAETYRESREERDLRHITVSWGRQLGEAIEAWAEGVNKGARPTATIYHPEYGLLVVEIVPSGALAQRALESRKR